MSTIHLDDSELSRLTLSLGILSPRLDAITAEFCRMLEHASPSLRLRLPSNERVLVVGIEEILETVHAPDTAYEVMARYTTHARAAGVEDTDLPVLLASIQTAMAEVAGYTWTEAQEDAWTCWLDALANIAVRGSSQGGTQAA